MVTVVAGDGAEATAGAGQEQETRGAAEAKKMKHTVAEGAATEAGQEAREAAGEGAATGDDQEQKEMEQQ